MQFYIEENVAKKKLTDDLVYYAIVAISKNNYPKIIVHCLM